MKKTIDFAYETLQEVLKGNKPDIDMGDKNESWMYNQIVRMRADFFVSEIAKSYVFLLEEVSDLLEKGEYTSEAEARTYLENAKGITKYHSFGHALMEQNKNIHDLPDAINIKNYKMLGYDYGYRNPETDVLNQAKDADAFVLAPGDFYSLYQFTALLKEKEAGKMQDKHLVVYNEDGFWDETIDALGLVDNKHVNVVHSKKGLKNTLSLLGDNMSTPAIYSKDVLKVKPQSVALLQTGNNKKVHELRKILSAQNAIVEVLPFSIVVGKPKDPDEVSHTATANAYEKFESVQELILSTSLDSMNKSLRRRGIDPQNVTVWLDDRAVEFAVDYFKTKLFDDCREKMNEYKPGPNAELANILKVVPIREFYRRLQESTKILMEENERLGAKGPLQHTSDDAQVYIVAPLQQQDITRPEYYAFHAIVENSVNFVPVNDGGKHVYSEHYLSMVEGNPENKRNIEREDYFSHHSPMSKAIQAAMNVLGMDQHERDFNNDPKIQFENARKTESWKVGLSSNAGRKSLHGTFDEFDLMTAEDAKFSFKGAALKQKSGLERYLSFLKESDAYVWLPEHDVDPKDHKLFWKNLYLWMSEVVGKQVFNPNIHGKPLVVVDKGDEGACGPLVELFDHMHDMGFLGDKPEHIYKRVETSQQAADYINKVLPKRRRPYLENVQFHDEGVEQREDLSTVTIYGSATNENPEIYDQTNALSACLAALGFANKNGGGRDGTMRRMNDGAHFARGWAAETGNELPDHHLASIQCEDTYRSEGVYGDSEGQVKNDYTCYCPSIEKRMDILGETNAEIVLPGGAGTIQEIAGSILKRLYSKDASDPHRPLIIVNQEIHGKRIYDPLVKRMPETMIRDLNIHVVDNWLEALDIVVESRRARGDEPKNIPYDKIGDMLAYIDADYGFSSGLVNIDEARQWAAQKSASNQNNPNRPNKVAQFRLG